MNGTLTTNDDALPLFVTVIDHDFSQDSTPRRMSSPAAAGPSFRPPQPPSTAPSTRTLLATALSKAQTAVQLDAASDFSAAESAYRDAIRLLAVVLDRTESRE